MKSEIEDTTSKRPDSPATTVVCVDEPNDSASPLLLKKPSTTEVTSNADTPKTMADLPFAKMYRSAVPSHNVPVPNKCKEAGTTVAKQDHFGSTCSNWSQPTSMASIKVSYELSPFSSTQSSLFPLCRICQLPHEKSNVLIAPCRCDGSVKHIHGTCLRVGSCIN